MTIASTKSSLWYISGNNSNLMIATAKIDLGEILRTLQAIEQLIHTRQWVTVLDRDLIESAIVDAHSHRAVFLLDEEDRCAEWRFRRLDEPSLGQFLQLLF